MPAGDERRRDALVRTPVRRLQRHLNRAVWLRALVAPLWGAATFFAVWRLLVRFHPYIAGVVGLVAAIVIWILRARRAEVSEHEAAVRADRLAGANGLLLTRLEKRLGDWELELNASVRKMPLPKQPLGRPLSLSVLAVAFVAAVLLVPAPPDRSLPVNAAAANKLAEVEARAEALAKEEPLDGAMEAELQRLREELEENRFDAADWEAADGLDSALQQKAAEAASELRKAEEAAKSLEDAIAKAGESSEAAAREQENLERELMNLSDGESQSGEDALEQAMQQAAEQQGGDQKTGQQQAGDSEQKSGDPKSGDQKSGDQKSGDQKSGDQKSGQQKSGGQRSLSRSQAQDLKKALQNRQQQLAKAFGQQQQQQQQARAGGKGAGKNGKGKDGENDGQGEGEGQGKDGAGKQHNDHGGPSRGGGEGELTFDHEGEVHPERLAFEPLPKGAGGDPDELWGLRGVDPKAQSNGASGNGTGGAAIGEQSPGRKNEQLLPRNRELIRRYFGGE